MSGAARIWEIRRERAAVDFNIAAAERAIFEHQTKRAALLAKRKHLVDQVYQEMTAMGIPKEDIRLDVADRLADAFIEGQATIKMGVLEPLIVKGYNDDQQ